MKSSVEISGARLAENYRAVQAVAGPGVEAMAVIKANGYGHDAPLCAGVLVGAGAKWLGIADVDEGMEVRRSLGQGSTRILVMGGMELADAPAMVTNGLTPVVWTPEHVAAMERAARSSGHRVGVHLEIDTGMTRQGAGVGAELAKTLERLTASRWLSCEGLMTHLAAAEVGGGEQTARQKEKFTQAIEQVTAAGIRPEFLHMANSSAVDEGSTLAWLRDCAKKLGAKPMVRTGYALYGHCSPIRSADGHGGSLAPRLKPVLTWKTCITGVREIEAGAAVGYNATFVAERPMRIALLPVGYYDGFRRSASSSEGAGWVMIAGKKAPVVGRVSMNLTTVDVTEIPEAAVGTEVTLLGEGVTAEDHARWQGTIGYEVLCAIRAKFELR